MLNFHVFTLGASIQTKMLGAGKSDGRVAAGRGDGGGGSTFDRQFSSRSIDTAGGPTNDARNAGRANRRSRHCAQEAQRGEKQVLT